MFFGQTGLQFLPKAQGDVRVFGSVVERFIQRYPVERDGVFPFASYISELDRLMVKVKLCQFVHTVTVLPPIQYVRQDHCIVDAMDGQAMPDQYFHVVLDVLADLQDRRVQQNFF